jgi:putative NADPH-quinone reductase
MSRPRPHRRTLVVVSHPVPESFVQALAHEVVDACRRRGDEVELIDLYAEGFDPVLSREEWRAKEDLDAVRRWHGRHVRLLEWADTLVLVHPTWFGGHPAMLKGWFDRVWAAGVAYLPSEGRRLIRPRLQNLREITVVTTHGSGKRVNSIQGEPGKRLTGRGLRVLCGWRCRRRWLAMYGMDQATQADRTAFLAKVRAAFR